MIHLIRLLVLWLGLVPVSYAVDVHLLPTEGQPSSQLVIYGAADYPAIRPLFQAFQARFPDISITYHEFNTREMYQRLVEKTHKGPDLVLSSAMDLQIKLVNDGYAQPYQSKETDALPAWAKWRSEIFGFTYEPAVIVVNTSFLAGEVLPRSRSELLHLIREKSAELYGRLGTLDIERVGLGYLTWANDRQASGSYGRILEAFGSHQARRFPSSSSLLKALDRGDTFIGYNLLGSYAIAAAKKSSNIAVIIPEDYTALVMRTVFMPKKATHIENAKTFIDFLLSRNGQQVLADKGSLFPIREDVVGEQTASNLLRTSQSRFTPIPLGPSLLVLTDKSKRELIIEEWEASMKIVD